MSSGNLTVDIFNKPSFWVYEFIVNNYAVSSGKREKKLKMYHRYKDYAIKHNKGELTLEEFHYEIMRQSGSIECITIKGDEYYTNFIYEPIDPNNDEFYRFENCIK